MAAVPETGIPALLDLRQMSAEGLDPLLEEAAQEWDERLHWDFRPASDLVRRFVRMQALNGYSLVAGGQVVGYCYYVLEDHKGLVGDLYVRKAFRSGASEERLLAAVLRSLLAMHHVQRVEAQVMMLGEARPSILPEHFRLYRRNFMVAPGPAAEALPARVARGWTLERWRESAQEAVARLIARAYHGHVDAEINDQYRSIAGARRFLMNIVQYPGCGSFFAPASVIAVEPESGRLLGASLASLVAFDVGHITQICVDPEVKGTGIGYALLRESMRSLQQARCRQVSLTVTAANSGAVDLYRRMGFRTLHAFDAMVWERPGR